MAKKKTTKTTKGKKKSPARTGPKTEPGAVEPCPSCGEETPLYWHGRRVLCEACIAKNTHEAERGYITMGNLVRGALALFRDVGWPVIAIVASFALAATGFHLVVELDDTTTLIAGFAEGLLSLIFVAAAFDYALTHLDGERPTIGSSLVMGLKKFLPLFLATQLQGLIVVVHCVFLIIPGVMKALSYALVTPLVVSGEAGAISCLHESTKRMKGHRKDIAPLLIALWIPFLAMQYLGLVVLSDPQAMTESPWLTATGALFPFVDLPWFFVILSLHAKLRAAHRLRVQPEKG